MLTDAFPQAVRVCGNVYPVNTDFRVGLKIMEAYEDPRLTRWEKQSVMCGLLFPQMPPYYEPAVKAAIKFLDCGKDPREDTGGPRVYSFTRDADFIYSAFLQTYGVDLRDPETRLHWWKFCAMFGDLSPDTTFETIRSFRDRYNRGKLTKDEKRIWFENRELLDLDFEGPDAETLAARENFEKLLRG